MGKQGGDRSIVPSQIKYLESHGLTLTRPLIGGKYHAGSCGFCYLCELCMKVDVTPNLPNILKRIPSEEAKEITDYYNFLKAAGNEPRGRLVKAVYAGLCKIVNTCSVNHPKEPKFFPMNRGGDRSIVPDQIKYLERHGLTLTRPLHGGKYHAMSCGATYLCELCMEVDVSPNLPNILKRIPSEEAKEITDYYNFLKAAGNEPRGRMVKAVYAGLCKIVNTCSVNHPKEPKFFPMNRGGDRSIVPDQIKYLERHGLTLTRPLHGGKYHAM